MKTSDRIDARPSSNDAARAARFFCTHAEAASRATINQKCAFACRQPAARSSPPPPAAARKRGPTRGRRAAKRSYQKKGVAPLRRAFCVDAAPKRITHSAAARTRHTAAAPAAATMRAASTRLGETRRARAPVRHVEQRRETAPPSSKRVDARTKCNLPLNAKTIRRRPSR